jgi:hypothetical protein
VLRALSRTRKDLQKARVALCNQLAAQLERCFPGAVGLFADLHSAVAISFLRRYPTSHAAAGLTQAKLTAFLRRIHYCGHTPVAVLLQRIRTAPAAGNSAELAVLGGVDRDRQLRPPDHPPFEQSSPCSVPGDSQQLALHLDGCAGTTVLTVLRGRGRTWLGRAAPLRAPDRSVSDALRRRPPDAPSRQAGGRRRPRPASISAVPERPGVHPGDRITSALSMMALGR